MVRFLLDGLKLLRLQKQTGKTCQYLQENLYYQYQVNTIFTDLQVLNSLIQQIFMHQVLARLWGYKVNQVLLNGIQIIRVADNKQTITKVNECYTFVKCKGKRHDIFRVQSPKWAQSRLFQGVMSELGSAVTLTTAHSFKTLMGCDVQDYGISLNMYFSTHKALVLGLFSGIKDSGVGES